MKTSCLTLIAAFLAAGLACAKSAVTPLDVRAELDRPVLPAGQTERAVIKIRLLPAEIETSKDRPPVNLAIALDRSGSMNGEKIAQAREAALEALSLVGLRDRFALVAYADGAETLIESQRPMERERLARIIRGIQSKGSTALYAGVSQAAAEIRRGATDGSFDRLILLSDGIANVGPSSTDDLSGLGGSLAGEDISVSTVGLGSGFNEDLMTALADTGQGNAYFAENARDLTRIFAAELDDVLNVTATDVEVIVECAPGVRPLRTIGRDGTLEDGRVSFDIRQLFGGQEKFALVEVEVPAGQAGELRDLVTVRTRYRDAVSGDSGAANTVAQVSYTESVEEVRDNANVEVARAVVDNRLAEAKQQAIVLSDAGQNAQAATVMRELRSDIDSMNNLYQDDTIAQQSSLMEQEAQYLDQAPLSNMKRKGYSNSSYMTVNQQKEIN